MKICVGLCNSCLGRIIGEAGEKPQPPSCELCGRVPLINTHGKDGKGGHALITWEDWKAATSVAFEKQEAKTAPPA
jgi:hypothetical protein